MGKKNILEMSVCAESWVDKKYTSDYQSIPKDELDNNSMWYLHGTLEDIVGYDKAYTTNCKSAGYSKETINWSCIKGDNVVELREGSGLTRRAIYINDVVPVKVKGVEEPCIGYFWTIDYAPVHYNRKDYPHWLQCGFVCLESDVEGRAYALKKYREKSEHI